jgi:hypothetical protein
MSLNICSKVDEWTRRPEGALGMASELELDIQLHLIRFLTGDSELHEFEDWFSPLLWNLAESNDPARELAGRIHNLIAEASRGDRSFESMREELASVISPFAQNRYGNPSLLPLQSNADFAVNQATAA